MDNVLMIIVVVAIALYPRKDTYIAKFRLKAGLKCVEIDISTNEKNGPPSISDRFNLKN